MNVIEFEDIFVVICNMLPQMKDVINLELLSNKHLSIIRKTVWYKNVWIWNDDCMVHIIKCYKLRNLTFDFRKDFHFNKYMDYISNCHTLSLDRCKNVTDKMVKLLINCHTLDLNECNDITDESVKFLGNCHNLTLSCCEKITDESVKFLGNCHTLILSYFHYVKTLLIKALNF